MTKNASRRASTRAPEIDPFPGNHPPSVLELDHGIDLFDCDPLADAIHWSTGILTDFIDLRAYVRTTLETLSSCVVNAVTLAACESACDQVADDLNVRPEERDRYADYAARCVYYGAFLGDQGCALRCAVRVWLIAMAGGHSDIGLRNLLTTHSEMMSIAAYCDGGDWRPKTEPRWARRQGTP